MTGSQLYHSLLVFLLVSIGPASGLGNLDVAIAAADAPSADDLESAREEEKPAIAPREQLYPVDISDSGFLHSTTTGATASKTPGEMFQLYGGPGTLEGTFEDQAGLPDAQGWIGVDRTQRGSAWHASQVNVENLGGGGGNWGVICRRDGNDYTGYGNNWNMWLLLRLDPSASDPEFDPATDARSVRLRFDFNHWLEETFDYFRVEWNRAGEWQEVAAFTGTNWDGSAWTPQSYDSQDAIAYAGGDYVDGEIQLRLNVVSDCCHSDEDGIYPSLGLGAAAVDDVELWLDGGLISVADWEPLPGKLEDLGEGDISGHDNGSGPGTVGWQPQPWQLAGDFSKLFMGFVDLDPCRDNFSPQFSFIDDGTPPNNDRLGRSTGGSTSPSWSYGVPGGWIVNHTDGISDGLDAMHNEIWSPPIDWDLPGTEDDAARGGAILSFDWWAHMTIPDGVFAVWHIRQYDAATGWGEWRDRNYVYYSSEPLYKSWSLDVSALIDPVPEKVQIALGYRDMADLYGFPGGDATPSPLFDNVSLAKYVLGGPIITAKESHLFQDSFPSGGSVDMADPAALAVRLDMAEDRSEWPPGTIVPGDSIVCRVIITDPAAALSSVSLQWALAANPAFDAVRTLPPGAALVGTTNGRWGERQIWTGSTPAGMVTDEWGTIIEDEYFFDLPDGPPNPNGGPQIVEPAMFFPGDVLHYYLQAQDDQGGITTLPSDTGGFLDFDWSLGTAPPTHDARFTVRGLPSLDATGEHPQLLLWYDGPFGETRAAVLDAFAQNCLAHGGNMDVYNTMGATLGVTSVSNGLGSPGSHGATPEQLAGYEGILYVSGRGNKRLLSDGSDGSGTDKSDDIGLLTAWHAQDDRRFHAYFGDDFGEGMSHTSAQADYLRDFLGAAYQGPDVSIDLDDQKAPVMSATPWDECFGSNYQVYGDCPTIRDLDHIRPAGASILSHEFLDAQGAPYPSSIPAGIEWIRQEGGKTKHTQVFGFGLDAARWPPGSPPASGSGAASLLRELLICAGFQVIQVGKAFCTGTGAPDLEPTLRLRVEQNVPNPFNPVTIIRYTAPADGRSSVRVYSVRGELVATLHDGPVEAGEHELRWDGRDARGRGVASGVYFYRVSGFGYSETRKMALIR